MNALGQIENAIFALERLSCSGGTHAMAQIRQRLIFIKEALKKSNSCMATIQLQAELAELYGKLTKVIADAVQDGRIDKNECCDISTVLLCMIKTFQAMHYNLKENSMCKKCKFEGIFGDIS